MKNNANLRHIGIDGLSDILLLDGIFNGTIRSCMMHYGIEGCNVISEEYLDRPMYGMIETSLEGMRFEEYLAKLRRTEDTLINFLENQFDFSRIEMMGLGNVSLRKSTFNVTGFKMRIII